MTHRYTSYSQTRHLLKQTEIWRLIWNDYQRHLGKLLLLPARQNRHIVPPIFIAHVSDRLCPQNTPHFVDNSRLRPALSTKHTLFVDDSRFRPALSTKHALFVDKLSQKAYSGNVICPFCSHCAQKLVIFRVFMLAAGKNVCFTPVAIRNRSGQASSSGLELHTEEEGFFQRQEGVA